MLNRKMLLSFSAIFCFTFQFDIIIYLQSQLLAVLSLRKGKNSVVDVKVLLICHLGSLSWNKDYSTSRSSPFQGRTYNAVHFPGGVSHCVCVCARARQSMCMCVSVCVCVRVYCVLECAALALFLKWVIIFYIILQGRRCLPGAVRAAVLPTLCICQLPMAFFKLVQRACNSFMFENQQFPSLGRALSVCNRVERRIHLSTLLNVWVFCLQQQDISLCWQ